MKAGDRVQAVWMKITQDEYELPVAVADSSDELGEICGCDGQTIRCAFSRYNLGQRKSTKYIKVMIDDD